MQRYNYIALLILSTFLLKLLVVDTQWIIPALTGQEIHFNPFCVNKNPKGEAHDPAFTLEADHTVTGSLSGICTVQIVFDNQLAENAVSPFHEQIIHRSLDPDDIFREANYPPPQLPLAMA